MADLTAKLLWYRVNESSSTFSWIWQNIQFILEAGGSVLNWIFICWIVFGLLTIIVVTVLQTDDPWSKLSNVLTQILGLNIKQAGLNQSEDNLANCTQNSSSKNNSIVNQEWINALLRWIFKNDDISWTLPITDRLLTSLSEASKKIGGDILITFEAVLPNSPEPLVTKSSSSVSSENVLMLNNSLILSGMKLSLTSLDNSVLIHSNVLVTFDQLEAEVETQIKSNGYELLLTTYITAVTSIDLQFLPYHQGVDYIPDEKKLLAHMSEILLNVKLPLTISVQAASPEQDEISAQSVNHLESSSFQSNTQRPPKPPRTIEDKKLMIKLIKATRLNKRNTSAIDAYCMVEVDSPKQAHSTSIVKNTVNPYWDEHFLFDLGTQTKVVTFRVYQQNEECVKCLGEAQVEIEKLRANHGVRMVLPLDAMTDDGSAASGSVTIEGYFVDAAEFEQPVAHEDDVFSESIVPAHANAGLRSSESNLSRTRESTASLSSLSEPSGKIIKTMTYTQKDVGTSNPTGDAFPVVEKKETLMNQPKGGKIVELVKEQESIDITNAEVITVYPNQSITDVVIKELQDRAQRPRPSGQKTTTLIITAASRSDESNVPSLHNDPGILQPRTTQPGEDTSPSIEQPVKESRLAAGLSNQPPAPERQSRLSFLKKRFTRTKDKKARSHSIERSSGIDEHRYLSPATSPMGGSSGGSMTSVDSGAPNTPVPAPSPKKKFGGSLRKLFHLKKRSSSKSREKPSSASDRHMNILTDLEKNYQNSQYDRLSIERDDQSKSSMEQELTPHRRVITPSTSNYNNNFDGNDTLEQSVEDHNRNFFPDDDKRHSLPYKKSPKMTI